jgi:uncharacterized oxidoreductase
MTKYIDHEKLRDIVAEICINGGSEGDEPRLVADNLVMANLMGHDSHGVGMLPRYIECMHSGTLNPNAGAKIVVDSGALIVVDGGAGYGQVIGGQSMDFGIERAKEHGVAIVATRNSFHLCRIGAWAERCARAGFISMHHTNVMGHKPLVAPYGGSQARYSTNPYTVGLPATAESPMTILDMATSVVALGKVRVAKNKGEQMAEGILLDGYGKPSTDPNVMYNQPYGAAMPFGAHKGGGLALMNELLAGILSGGQTMRPETQPKTDAIINNMLSIIIDPSKLVDNAFYSEELDATLKYVKASKPIDPDKPVLVPGEPEQIMKADREANGVPIDDNTWEEILAAGDSVGFGRNRITDMSV